MAYGVTATGFNVKTLTTVDDEVDADLQNILGASAGSDEDGKIPVSSMAGQLKSLIVDGIAAMWDLQEAVYASHDPNQAGGASLDAIGAITGTIRNEKSFSVATGTCVGTANTFLTAGRVATVENTGSRFLSLQGATLSALTAWAGSTGYAVGQLVTNNSRAYRCTTAGTAAATPGPSGTSLAITDGGVTWRHLGQGTAGVHVQFQAEDAGEIAALANTLNTIGTPVNGWNAVDNQSDAGVGNLRETDSAFRVRRDQELAAAGNTTPDAIRANILAVNEGSTDPNHQPPTSCTVLFNDTDVIDANGLPPHSVECIVYGGTDADIIQAIWESVGAGTATHGLSEGLAVDSEGNSQYIRYTRPTEVPIFVTATVYYDATQWPSGSDTLVAETAKSALLTFTEDFEVGRDVRASALIGAIMRGPAAVDASGTAILAGPDDASVTGILEVDPLYFGTSPSPSTSTTVTITIRQVADLGSGDVNITATTETP